MKNIVMVAFELGCKLWFVLNGVNAAEMLLWNRLAYRVRPVYDESGKLSDVKVTAVKITQFIRIPKRHGMMSAFMDGSIIPVILLPDIDLLRKLDAEMKTEVVKMLNNRLLNKWKMNVLSGKLPPASSPQIAWFHPTANRQPESLIYLGTPEALGEFAGMDPYSGIERLNKALGPASTPSGWECVKSSHKELRLLVVDEDAMQLFYRSGNALSIEDGPVILRDYVVRLKPYVSDVAKVFGAQQKTETHKNLAFQVRVRGEVIVNDLPRRIIAKCCCNGCDLILASMAKVFGIGSDALDSIDGILRADNFKSKNVRAGAVVVIRVEAFEVAKTASVKPENSSSLGIQAVVGDQAKMRILHKEHSMACVRKTDGSTVMMSRADILRQAIWNQSLAANFHILVGDKAELSMEDFKPVILNMVCNAVKGPNGTLQVVFAESWLNTLIARWVRFLRTRVFTVQGSKYSHYIGAVSIMRVEGSESIMNELDDLRLRHYRTTGEWIYPVLPPRGALLDIIAEGWRFINKKKDPQTSALNLQGCSFCYRDDDGILQFLTNDLQEIMITDMVECSCECNAWGLPTPDEDGEDKDGDLLSVLLSREVHFGSRPTIFPFIKTTGKKDKVAFTRPTCNAEWDEYVSFINSQYDGYAIAAKNTGMLDLETRLQCIKAIIEGVLDNGVPFSLPIQRCFNYIREELGIKVSKHGVGGKTGSATATDPQALLRELTFGEIKPKNWPNLFRATHKYGGVPLASRHDNRLVLQTILKAVWNAERERKDGSTIDFFLDYAFESLRKSGIKNLQLPRPQGDKVVELARQYSMLWEKKKVLLSQGCIFSPSDVIAFVGEKRFQGIRGIYSDLSRSYNARYDKAECYRGLSLAFSYFLGYYPYYRGPKDPEKFGMWPPYRILREYVCSKYKRFRPIRDLLFRDNEQLTPEENNVLQEKGWFDLGIEKEDGTFIVFEKGLKSLFMQFLGEISIPTIANWLPQFWVISDPLERIKQTDNFFMLCIIYMGKVGFGAGSNAETQKSYTRVPSLLSCFKPELYIEVARMRYSMIGVQCALLDELPQLCDIADEYVAQFGYTVEGGVDDEG
jgi:hypothetical protein